MTLSRIITTSITGLLTSVLILSGITTSAISQDNLNKKQLYVFGGGIGQYTSDTNREIINSNNLFIQSSEKFKECEIKLDKANIESAQFLKDNANGQKMTIGAFRKKLSSQPEKIIELNRLEKALETAISICDQGMVIQDRFDTSVCIVSDSLSKIESLIFNTQNILTNTKSSKDSKTKAEKTKKELLEIKRNLDPKAVVPYNQYVNRKNQFENLKRKYPKYLKSIAPYAKNYCPKLSMALSQIIERNNKKNKPNSKASNTRNNNLTIARNLKTNNKNNRTIS